MNQRRFLTPELEAEIRADERAKARAAIAAELTGGGNAVPGPLTIEAIKKMTPEQILERRDEVDRVVAAWDGSTPEPQETEA